jgi:enoyl-CoA hydratase
VDTSSKPPDDPYGTGIATDYGSVTLRATARRPSPKSPVSYQHSGPVALITMNDGKANALGPAMLVGLNKALDRAEANGAVVVLTGREGTFCAGFDLDVLRGGGRDADDMIRAGFELAARLLSFPTPVVIGCSGHAVAMGAFLLLSADYRIGITGPYRITANEVAIGKPMPQTAIEISRPRLSPSHLERAISLAEIFSPDEAVVAGFLDRVVEPSSLSEHITATAINLAKLDLRAHAASKRRVRNEALTSITAAIEIDLAR